MKRLFDIFATIILACALCLPLVILSAIQLAVLGRPIFFRQQRAGKNGQALSILKFRTMRTGAGSDAERLIPWGRFLRSTSLDELPELWNVLRGEMSLVGPRPLPITYLERYSAAQAKRHDVRPGITGWAQVNALRGDTDLSERVRFDLHYIENWNVIFDAQIIRFVSKK